MNIIQTERLNKRYGETIAVNEVSIHVKQGEIYGFLGLNGAGKTTTIRMLLGLVKPDSGSCELFGKKLRHTGQRWNEVGYMIEAPHAYPELSVVENLRVIMKLRGLNDASLIDRTIDELKLGAYRNKKEKHLSMGNKQRLGLAKALIHRPKLLILDEPVNGLDPAGIAETRELLKDLALNHKTTIFLSSHILSEIARLTHRIGIIHNGLLIREIKTDDLEQQIIKKLVINTNDNIRAAGILADNNYKVNVINGMIEMPDSRAIEFPEKIAELLVQKAIPPKKLNVFKEDLEHYFLRIING